MHTRTQSEEARFFYRDGEREKGIVCVANE